MQIQPRGVRFPAICHVTDNKQRHRQQFSKLHIFLQVRYVHQLPQKVAAAPGDAD
jgi:hypothetical protein